MSTQVEIPAASSFRGSARSIELLIEAERSTKAAAHRYYLAGILAYGVNYQTSMQCFEKVVEISEHFSFKNPELLSAYDCLAKLYDLPQVDRRQEAGFMRDKAAALRAEGIELLMYKEPDGNSAHNGILGKVIRGIKARFPTATRT